MDRGRQSSGGIQPMGGLGQPGGGLTVCAMEAPQTAGTAPEHSDALASQRQPGPGRRGSGPASFTSSRTPRGRLSVRHLSVADKDGR
jgi:hypothetical protein